MIQMIAMRGGGVQVMAIRDREITILTLTMWDTRLAGAQLFSGLCLTDTFPTVQAVGVDVL